MEDKIKVFLTARDTDDRLTEKQPLTFEDDPGGHRAACHQCLR